MGKVLVQFDTNGIKEYVFGTGKLKEIRGGSAILDELNRITMPKIINNICSSFYREIYANGGAGMYILPDDKLEEVKTRLKNEYVKKGSQLTINSIMLPEDFDWETGNHQPILTELAFKTKILKDNGNIISTISNPYFRPCDSDKKQLATKRKKEHETIQYISESCFLKREQDEKVKNQFRSSQIREQSLWEKLNFELMKNGYFKDFNQEDIERPNDFGELGKISKNYIALIYADGNDMGQAIKNLHSLKDLKEFSETIDSAVYKSVAVAINEHLKPYKKLKYPFDILLIGGDDLVMVVKADKALESAIKIAESFYKFTNGNSLSVGIAFAHSSFPFKNLLAISEDLLKNAKKECANRLREDQNDSAKRGMINFMVINNSNTLTWEDYRNDTLVEKTDNEQIIRTLRPYSIENLRDLIDNGKICKKIAMNKLQALRIAAYENKYSSMLKSLQVLGRVDKQEKEALYNLVDFTSGGDFMFPWKKRGNQLTTSIIDFMEIVEFIGE